MEYTEIELLSEYALSKNTTLSKLQNLPDVLLHYIIVCGKTGFIKHIHGLVIIYQNKYVLLLSGDTKICCPSVFMHRFQPSVVRYMNKKLS